MASDLARKTAEVANRDVGIREKGQNRGKRIEEYQRTVGIGPGNPYCIAAVCTWMKEAAQELGVPRKYTISSASALRFLEHNQKSGMSFSVDKLTPDMIPCVFVIDHGGGKGHAGLVVGESAEPGTYVTIEANTNQAGSREGDGVYSKTRHVSEFAGLVSIE